MKKAFCNHPRCMGEELSTYFWPHFWRPRDQFVTRRGRPRRRESGQGMSVISEYTSSPDSIPASDGTSSTSTTPRCGPMSGFSHLGAARPPSTKAAAAGRVPAGAKRQGKVVKQLPPPLTEALLLQAMTELPDGTRRATETCYQCFQVPCNSLHCSEKCAPESAQPRVRTLRTPRSAADGDCRVCRTTNLPRTTSSRSCAPSQISRARWCASSPRRRGRCWASKQLHTTRQPAVACRCSVRSLCLRRASALEVSFAQVPWMTALEISGCPTTT
jgi:hypothetical protein